MTFASFGLRADFRQQAVSVVESLSTLFDRAGIAVAVKQCAELESQIQVIEETIMRKVILAAIFLMVVQGAALAQGSNERRGWGYGFAGAGASSGDFSRGYFQVGGGGEGLVQKGFGVGAEVGYLAPFQGAGNGIGIFSGDVSYHFNRASRLVPFVTGGYSAAFRSGASHGGNFGGGVQYWMKEHVGLRLEFRDHVFSSDSPHLFQFRVGLAFR